MNAINAAVDIFYKKVLEDDTVSHFFADSDMGDVLDKPISFGKDRKPLNQLESHYTYGTSGVQENPYGQLLILLTFWNEIYGFHMEINTLEEGFEQNLDRYRTIFETIKSTL